jgi:phospholipase C
MSFIPRNTILRPVSSAVALALYTAVLSSPALAQAAPAALPLPAHVVVVMEENHAYSQIIGSSQAPYINSLATEGALFTNSYAITHPSEPNYLALFSGSTQVAKKTFTGYSEGLPSVGSEVCTSGEYARKHVPWTDFSDLASTVNQPFTAFPANYANLPTVSWVIPDLLDDMHDGSIQQGDSWLQTHLSAYVTWAKTNNSLLIVTWDEDNDASGNHIPTIFVGPMVKPGKYSEKINHYNVLRTLEAIYGVPYLGNAASVKTITDVWQ